MDNNQPWNNNPFAPQNGQVPQNGQTPQNGQASQGNQTTQQANQPWQNNQNANPNSAPNPVLESPILSPTHFDNIPKPTAATPAPPKKDATKNLTIIAIILGVVAVIGIVLGIWGLIDSMGVRDDLAAAEAQLAVDRAVINKIETQTGKKITNADSVPDYAPITGYIYIPEWGIKIGIPDNLHQISYIVDEKYRPQICFNGLETSVTNIFPAFADVDRNPGGMGCLTRVDINEGNSNSDGYSFGELVYTANGYNYFYSAPSKLFSTDAGEQGLEQAAVQIIKNMLTQNVSSYQ
ncbi:hypothetical protein IJH74_00280 [Candidatus Saccharibacteria bacterium]|nr:hypothetical protein [Candidatus Saccharibacteria bacterium]